MCLSVGTKKTRISNWTGSTIELHLKNASQETVPKGRKKLRCERAGQLCGGCFDTLTIWVYNHEDPSHSALPEPISGDDLEKCAELKVRQRVNSPQMLLLRIPRAQPCRTTSHSSHHSSHSHSSTYSQVSYSSHASAGSS